MISLKHSDNGRYMFEMDVRGVGGEPAVEFMVEADTETVAWVQVAEKLRKALAEAKQHLQGIAPSDDAKRGPFPRPGYENAE